MHCPKCGKELNDSARFCTGCGTAMMQAPAQSAPTESLPPPAAQQSGGVPLPPPKTAGGIPAPPAGNFSAAPAFASSDHPGQPSDATPPDDPFFIPKKTSPFLHVAILVAVIGVISVGFFVMKNAPQPSNPVTGTFTDTKFKYAVTLPQDGWRQATKPSLNFQNVSAEFFKGKRKPHDVKLIILYETLLNEIQPNLPPEALTVLKPVFINAAEQIVAREGYKYEHIKLSFYPSAKTQTIWLEGNAKKGSESKRTFLFLFFEGNRAFDLWFSFKEKDTQKYWPEIKSIVDSFEMQ